MYSYQSLCTTLNHGLSEGTISPADAVLVMVTMMPETLHIGTFSIPSPRGVVVLRNRLTVWEPSEDGTTWSLHDLFTFLDGN